MGQRKGNKHESEAMKVYESFGFQTWKPSATTIRKRNKEGKIIYISLQQDIAKAFDFIAWNKMEVHLVQVKSGEGHASEARQKIDKLDMPLIVTQVVLMRIYRKKHQFISWTLQENGNWDRQEFNENKFFGIEIEE